MTVRVQNSVVAAILPTIISEVGQGIRAWLDHRRKKELEKRMDAVEKRLDALEGK